jgi:bifunctional non-homologous end joining protein LigD
MSGPDADSGASALWQVDGHPLQVTHLDKPYWPQAGVTKGEMLQYYVRIAPVALPYFRDRPVTLRMYPDGVDSPSYYLRERPERAPAWLRSIAYRPKTSPHFLQLPVIDDAASLIWLANAGAIEFHLWGACLPELTLPDQAIFDLDPGEAATFEDVLQSAQHLRHALDALHVASYPKTSGGRGLHLVAPLEPDPAWSFERVRAWIKDVAEQLAGAFPHRLALPHGSTHRGDRVTIDYAQNSVGRNTAAPYSLRAYPAHPVVSTPLSWQEVEAGDMRPADLTPAVVLDRVQRLGDLFAPVVHAPQRLPPLHHNQWRRADGGTGAQSDETR